MKTYSFDLTATYHVSVPVSFAAETPQQAKEFLLAIANGESFTDAAGVTKSYAVPVLDEDADPNYIAFGNGLADDMPEPLGMDDLSFTGLQNWDAERQAYDAVFSTLMNWAGENETNRLELVDELIHRLPVHQAQALADRLMAPGVREGLE